MPAVEDGDVPDRHVEAVLQSDGLVARPLDLGFVVGVQSSSPDHPIACDRDVAQAVAVDQAVLPVAVAEVLKLLVPGILLRQVVSDAVCLLVANQHGTLV